jgi:hypothetical protein
LNSDKFLGLEFAPQVFAGVPDFIYPRTGGLINPGLSAYLAPRPRADRNMKFGFRWTDSSDPTIIPTGTGDSSMSTRSSSIPLSSTTPQPAPESESTLPLGGSSSNNAPTTLTSGQTGIFHSTTITTSYPYTTITQPSTTLRLSLKPHLRAPFLLPHLPYPSLANQQYKRRPSVSAMAWTRLQKD